MNKCIEIEQAAKKCGLPIAEMCKRAGINRATWQRWKSGVTSPTMRNWDRVNDVVNAASKRK